MADVKCWSSMRKWQRCTFLHSMWSSLSLLRNRHPLQGSRLKTVFFEQGTETRTHTQGMGCFSAWFQGFPSHFLCSSLFSFFHLSLRSLCTASFCPVCVYRSCRPKNRCEGIPTQAFGAFLRGVSQAPLPGLLKPSPAVQMYDVYCGLASFGSYVSDLVICVVMPFSSGLHISTSSPT